MKLEVYHTQEVRENELTFPVRAEGWHQWLGDGFYFWQDYQFALRWGVAKKCKPENLFKQFCLCKAILIFEEEEFIDTVFNEEDYYYFANTIEKFAEGYLNHFGNKPNLSEFNEFISYFRIWEKIKIIRFQDVPENDLHVSVTGFYYKKRIQIRVNDPDIISNFAVLKNVHCQ